MKKLTIVIVPGLLALLLAAAVHAETRYVNDLLEITLRTGPGLDYRIVRMLQSGQQLEVLETTEGWTRVRLPDGTTGWVFTRYLSEDKPSSTMLESLREEIGPLRNRVQSLAEENQRLIKHNQELGDKLAETQSELERIRKEYNSLKEASSDYLKLKNEYSVLRNTLDEKEKRIQTLEKQVSDTRLSSNLRWFLAGAGVLLLGMIIGHRTASRKRRPTLR